MMYFVESTPDPQVFVPASPLETWREYPEFIGRPYEASSLGRIRARRSQAILQTKVRKGYLRVQLTIRNLNGDTRRVWRSVHTMVCTAFHGKRPSPAHEACHRNGQQPDCAASNVYWGTRTDQIEDKRKHGTLPKSVPPPSEASKYAHEILCLLRGGFSRTRIAKIFGCHRSTITKIEKRVAS